MSGIYGALNISDTERAFVSTIGQQVVFDAVNQVLTAHNVEVTGLMAIFIEKMTEDHQERYVLPGGGELQQLGTMAPAMAVKRYGYFDVAYPLRGWGAQQAGNRVDLAYMSIQELDAHLDTIMLQNLNTLRRRILTALFENDNLSWTDPIHGALTIRRLANGDGTLYPPVLGSEDEAEDTHHLGAAYSIAEILITANPIPTLRDEVLEHFGGLTTEGRQFVVLHNEDATSYLASIDGFTKIEESFITPGADTAVPSGWPTIPGRVHGRLDGGWLSEWAWMPAKFMVGILMDAPPPLVMRVDPADTGLPQGLQLIANNSFYPMQGAHYEHRFGIAVGNRLSASVIYINDDSTYAPPTGYTE